MKALKPALDSSVVVPRPASWLRDGRGSQEGIVEETGLVRRVRSGSSHTLSSPSSRHHPELGSWAVPGDPTRICLLERVRGRERDGPPAVTPGTTFHP